MILLRITVKGLGGSAVPVASKEISLFDCFVNIKILHGLKTIGYNAEATAETSALKYLKYLSLSFYPGLGSTLKVGLIVKILNPQCIKTSCFDVITSVFSKCL